MTRPANVLLGLGTALAVTLACRPPEKTERVAFRMDAVRVASKPVIWPFVGSRDTAESVCVALRSGLITHVAIFAGNRGTSDTLTKPETQLAIDIAKRHGAALILVRYLWRTQPPSPVQLLYEPMWYRSEIQTLRAEAFSIGARYIGMDVEAYGPTPITEHMRLRQFDKASYDRVVQAVKAATDYAGPVDFVLPTGSARANHPYIALAGLGRNRISEETYYDRTDYSDWAWIRAPFDVPGFYMDTSKENPVYPHLQYYLPAEVFSDKQHLWRNTGVFLWPREHRASEVARELLIASLQRVTVQTAELN